MAYDYSQPSGGQGGGSDPYANQRNQAAQRAAGQQSANYDALQRRFANNGGMNSGAAIQAEGNADRGTQQDLENTQGKISEQQGQNDISQQQKQTLMGQEEGFQGQQATAARAQQESQFGRSQAQQQSQFSQELPLKSRALDLEANQQGMDEQAMQFNENLATYAQNNPGGLFGGGGALGLGIDNPGKSSGGLFGKGGIAGLGF